MGGLNVIPEARQRHVRLWRYTPNIKELEMTDEKQNEKNNDLARRDFVALSVAAGLTAAAAGSALAKDMEVVETMVEVKTPDGTADAAFIHPASGSHPGVLVWTDAFGLRPSMRAIGKR